MILRCRIISSHAKPNTTSNMAQNRQFALQCSMDNMKTFSHEFCDVTRANAIVCRQDMTTLHIERGVSSAFGEKYTFLQVNYFREGRP